ncbi:hypothetical protein PQX77_016198 [Marasmius sp. AFHP31]|nr:hypothetical protein PQX77_016198 [Marasmius sp. AFHP31]
MATQTTRAHTETREDRSDSGEHSPEGTRSTPFHIRNPATGWSNAPRRTPSPRTSRSGSPASSTSDHPGFDTPGRKLDGSDEEGNEENSPSNLQDASALEVEAMLQPQDPQNTTPTSEGQHTTRRSNNPTPTVSSPHRERLQTPRPSLMQALTQSLGQMRLASPTVTIEEAHYSPVAEDLHPNYAQQ